jgi:hypothetical protein
MELYASAALNGVGYMLNNERDTLKRNETPVNKKELPSMTNVYNSTYYPETRQEELRLGTVKWNASQKPLETGVVPKPAYADMFARPFENDSIQNNANSAITTLAGTEMLPEQFAHNNMQPFIRGSVKQNVDLDANTSKLQTFTGRSDNYQHKKEVTCFFEPSAGYGNPCGFMPNPNELEREHIQLPKARNNDFPIDQIRVGKGLGLGYTSDGGGGFQQASTLDFVRPKTVDELRVATNPRVTYQLPPKGPRKAVVTERGIIGNLAKNKPDKFFEQTKDMWFTTTGAQIKEAGRPIQEVKPTARVDTHRDYAGSAYSTSSQPGQGLTDNYGKDSIIVFNNTRDDTGQRTVISNLTSTIKAIIAPYLDYFRHTQKEYTIDSSRLYGNMHAQIPQKATTYEPTSTMRTTIKETTLDGGAHTFGNMHAQVPEKPTTYEPTSTMKTTIKETTLDGGAHTYGNMHAQIPAKQTTYDPVTHMMKTTIKETTIHDTTISNLKGADRITSAIMDDAKTTIRETVPVEDTTLNIAAHTYRVTVYNVDEVAKTTVRQTTDQSSSMYGFIGGNVSESTGAYSVIDVNMKNTQKQFTSDYEYMGSSESKNDFRLTSEEADRNARIDPTRDLLNKAAGHTPNGGGGYTSLAPEAIDMQTNKLISDSISERKVGNISRITQYSAMPVDTCEVTNPTNNYLNANKDRLDVDILSALKTNPYSLSINPI